MHNKVVYQAMKAFQGFGLPVLRFNFRGTELSAGEHDHGEGEQDDVRAALGWLKREFELPILFAGFSFGSFVGLRACCGDARVVGLVALGLPTRAEGRDYRYDFLRECVQPKLFVSGTRDQYGPVAGVEAAVALAREPKELVWISDADHFFAAAPSLAAAGAVGARDKSAGSKLEDVKQAIRAWAQCYFPVLSSQ